jgi:hypothetical protein
LQLFRRRGREAHRRDYCPGNRDGDDAGHEPEAARARRRRGLLALEPKLIQKRSLIGHGGALSRRGGY